MPDLLEIDSFTKAFGLNAVLTDVYLKCQTGDIIGLLGRNGTGKSTLLKIVFGTDKADSSFIRINGVIYRKPYQTAGLVAYLPQDSFLPVQLTVAQAIAVYLGKNRADVFSADEIISNVLHHKIGTLSGGELRYLEIRLLLALPVKFLLMDEPFNGISPVMIDKVKELIKECSTHKGIIITDHDYTNVLDVATRYCLLHDGNLKAIGSRDELVRWGYLTNSMI